MSEETSDSQRRETTALFVSNIVLTTRLKKLLEENRELRKSVAALEVPLEDQLAVEPPRGRRTAAEDFGP